jgi:hypothetical protein
VRAIGAFSFRHDTGEKRIAAPVCRVPGFDRLAHSALAADRLVCATLKPEGPSTGAGKFRRDGGPFRYIPHQFRFATIWSRFLQSHASAWEAASLRRRRSLAF